MLYAIVGVLFLLADQALKLWTVSNVDLNTGISKLIPGFLHVTHIKNFGAVFGILKNAGWLRWAALLLLLAIAAGMILCLRRGVFQTALCRWSGVLLLAGLIGNGLDRALFGYVVDMLEFEFGKLPIFNLADLMILVAGIIFCVSLILGGADFSALSGKAEEEPMPRRRGDDYGYAERPRRREDDYDRPVRRPASEPGVRQRSAATGEQPARARRPIDEDSLPVPERARRTTPENIGEQPIRTRRSVEAQPELTPRPRRPIDENSLPARPRSAAQGEQSVRQRSAAQGEQPIRQRPVEGQQPIRQRPAAQGEQPIRQRPVEGQQPIRQRPAAQGEQPIRQRPAAQGEQPVRSRPVEGQQPIRQRPAPVEQNVRARTAAPAPQTVTAPSEAPARRSTLDMDLDSILAEFDD